MSNLTELFKIFVKNNNLKLIEWNDFFNLLNNFGQIFFKKNRFDFDLEFQK